MDKNNLYKTLVYFDMFSYPLTKMETELWQWSDSEPLVDINRIEVKEKEGFYFLPGREEIVRIRQERYTISDRKIIKARRLVKMFRLLPSVEMIAVCNSLGYQNARSESDIDLFVITSPGKVWLTRFWLTGLVRLLRLRPYDKNGKADTFCLTFFISSDNLNIENLKITEPDIYLTYWLTQLLPLYDKNGVYEKFLSANSWIKKNLPNCVAYLPSYDRKVKVTAWSKLFCFLSVRSWEPWLKKIQLKILPLNLRQIANKDSRVVINDGVLKFHGVDDNRLKYQKQWQENLKK